MRKRYEFVFVHINTNRTRVRFTLNREEAEALFRRLHAPMHPRDQFDEKEGGTTVWPLVIRYRRVR